MSKHPKGVYLLALTEVAERFSYYGMRALLVLYMVAVFFTSEFASQVYGIFTGLVFLTPIVGGYVADRFWGNNKSIIFGGILMAAGQFCMFFSAATAQQSIFQQYGAIDPSVNNTLSLILFVAGLVLIILGNGFFKPNISSMVGRLYKDGDERQEAGFTLFYMGINVGSTIAPFVCGMFQGSWDNLEPFKWGFFCAGIAMIISIICFISLKNKLLRTPEGKLVGLPPTQEQKDLWKKLDNSAGKTEAPGLFKRMRIIFIAVISILVFIFFADSADNITNVVSGLIFASGIFVVLFLITNPTLTKVENKHIWAILIFAILSIFFWAAFEQAGVSLTMLADNFMDRNIGSFVVPTAWFQSVNAIFVVILAPLMAALWDSLAKIKKNPSIPLKFAIGLTILSLGYFLLAFATKDVGGEMSTVVKISMLWLILLYFTQSIAELCTSPIGLSLVNTLAPKKFLSLVMGAWFISSSIGNVLAGSISAYFPTLGANGQFITHTFCGIEIATVGQFYLLIGIMVAAAAAIAYIIIKPLNKLMNAKEPEDEKSEELKAVEEKCIEHGKAGFKAGKDDEELKAMNEAKKAEEAKEALDNKS